MSDEQPKGLFTPGFASPWAGRAMGAGTVIAVLGIPTRTPLLMYLGIVVIAVGGLLDLLARVAGRKAMRAALFFFAFATAFIASHPALMAQWMGVLGQHAINLLGGK